MVVSPQQCNGYMTTRAYLACGIDDGESHCYPLRWRLRGACHGQDPPRGGSQSGVVGEE